MASGGSDLRTRMSAESYKRVCQIAVKLFKERKVEISHAIEATFPFFEKLRDRRLITEEKYKEFRRACDNQAPVPKVVYDVLSELEEKDDLSFLEILFSKYIIGKYPALKGIYKGFRNEILKEICYKANDGERSAKNHRTQLSLEKGTGENSYPGLSWLFSDQDTVTSSEASAEFGDGDKPVLPQASTSALTREPVSSTEAASGFRTEEKRPEAGSSAVRVGAAQEGPRKHEEAFVDFHSEILPVTGGEMKGMLYKNKLKEGSTVECIKTEVGNWLTPQKFEAAGGYKTSSNWKNTLRCGGKTLKRLMEEEKLPTPPRIHRKKRLKKTEACAICQNGEDLFSCDTCSRFFHGYCHLPPERPPRRPWSCTFCRIKESSGSQQCHGESEVLARPMGPEEQLKCEFLLLEIYCHSDSISFEQIHQDMYQSVETYQCMNNFMMLNKVKKHLSERRYPRVEGFMRDMRLIFQNHRAFNKNHALYLLGINLEEVFEQKFKKVFAIREIREEPMQTN